jgi:hypothetical protein
MRSLRFLFLLLPALALVSACSDVKTEPAGERVATKYQRKERGGKLTGEDGGFSIGGSKKGEEGSGAIGVNSFLWRATLDTLSFMPLVSADPFGGTIITDWYEDPQAPGERFKVNALILDRTLRADGVKLTVFKQRQDRGNWRDHQVDDKLARSLEDTILTRARQLKVTQLGK